MATSYETVWSGGEGLAQTIPSLLGAEEHQFPRLHLKQPWRALSDCDGPGFLCYEDEAEWAIAGDVDNDKNNPFARRTPGLKKCEVPGCNRDGRNQGMCWTHHMRRVRGASLTAPIRHKEHDAYKLCKVKGCGRKRVFRGFCMAHYYRDKKGQPLTTPIVRRVNRKERS